MADSKLQQQQQQQQPSTPTSRPRTPLSVPNGNGRGFSFPMTPMSINRSEKVDKAGPGSSANTRPISPTPGATHLSPSRSPSPSSSSTTTTLHREKPSPPLRSSIPKRSNGRQRQNSLLTEITSASVDEILESAPQGNSWHSVPLAFAVLPAVAGVVVKDSGQLVTDFLLLVLATVILRWVVKVPWDWYLASQPPSKLYTSSLTPSPGASTAQRQQVLSELTRHHRIAFTSCFLGPLLGGLLLHTIRAQLSRPSEGLVSNFNLTVFVLAAELRPLAHAIKLIRGKCDGLQADIIPRRELLQHRQRHNLSDEASNQLAVVTAQHQEEMTVLKERLQTLETFITQYQPQPPQQSQNLQLPPTSPRYPTRYLSATSTDKEHDEEVAALTRAVRRYEKSAIRTDDRIHVIEERLQDVLSLAAAAAVVRVDEERTKRKGVFARLWEWLWWPVVWVWRCIAGGLAGVLECIEWVLRGGRRRVNKSKVDENVIDEKVKLIEAAGMDTRRRSGAEREDREKERRYAGAVRVNHGHGRVRMKMPFMSGRAAN
ncbi:hypothetical protein EX30DRAFT_34353 [Ascodesmis nigricans]|uniref:Uncharacterized protein n=1 Tax=Ascodesmis nigricans TaxID=341454 RepID=A0A4S2MWM5_9PEZI|nr:hypothetical protein EX30DRAFT_34353 [Ascodesmis nigricans]